MALAMMAILVIAIVASFWIGSTVKSSSGGPTTTPQNSSIGQFGGPAQSHTPLPSVQNLVAPAGVTQTLLYFVKYPDYSLAKPLQYTTVSGQTVTCYDQATTPISTSGNLNSVSLSVSNTLANVAPGHTYLCFTGDNSGYFKNYTYVNEGLGNNYAFTIFPPKYSAPALSYSNSTSTGNVKSVNSIIHGATAASAKTYTFYLQLQAGQYTSCQQTCLVSLTANQNAFSSITLNGQNPVNPVSGVSSQNLGNPSFITTNGPDVTLIGTVGSQTKQYNFVLPAVSNSNYSTGTSQSYIQTLIPLQVTTTSTFNQNEIISAQVTPSTCIFNSSSGTPNCNVYVSQTGGTLFTPVNTLVAYELRIGG